MISIDSGILDLEPRKPEFRPRLYAWRFKDGPERWRDCLKVGETTRDVNTRIKESMGQAQQAYVLEVNQPADRPDGSRITDAEVRDRLTAKGFELVPHKSSREWVRCSPSDVETAIAELRAGTTYEGNRSITLKPRDEQKAAITKAKRYFESVWAEDEDDVPEFLWNAKMRFGKTFTTYEFAKQMGFTRVLVLTFKPAVEDAWRDDLENVTNFDGWKFRSRSTGGDPTDVPLNEPLVYFASFQDVLQKDKNTGTFKELHSWMSDVMWDVVVFDEYHFGAWRETSKELFEGEDEKTKRAEAKQDSEDDLEVFAQNLEVLNLDEDAFLPVKTRSYLYLSGTPFKVLREGRFIEEQIYNWTYADEQRAKAEFSEKHPNDPNPYATLPELRLMTYKMPEELRAIAQQGEFDEFDLNEFFAATGEGMAARFKHEDEVQKWLDIVRGSYMPHAVDQLKSGGRAPFPYSDVRLLPYLQHSLWMLPRKASCAAMKNLLAEPQNAWWHDYAVVNVSEDGVGVGLEALKPVREAIGSGYDTKTITLTVGKLTTGVTVPQWSSMMILRNLQAPETYFQAAFRVQSPWAIRNPDGDDPDRIEILKPVCYVFDFAPTRALRQLSQYGMQLQPDQAATNPEKAVHDLVSFLPVLAYENGTMNLIDAGQILEMAMSGTTATLLARRWESAVLVNVDNITLRKLLNDDRAMNAILSIEGFRSLSKKDFETVVNKSEALQKTKKERGDDLTPKEKRELSTEERETKSKRKQIQEKLIKFATRIPAFMYLTDYREQTLKDVIRKLEPGLFKTVTGLSIDDFDYLVSLGVFNGAQMDQAIYMFRRYENASLEYTGINSHADDKSIGLWDTAVPIREAPAA